MPNTSHEPQIGDIWHCVGDRIDGKEIDRYVLVIGESFHDGGERGWPVLWLHSNAQGKLSFSNVFWKYTLVA